MSVTSSMPPPLCLCTKKKDVLPPSCLLHGFQGHHGNDKDSDIVDFAQQSNFYESLNDDLMQSWMWVTAYGVLNPDPQDTAQVAINTVDIYCASTGYTTRRKTM